MSIIQNNITNMDISDSDVIIADSEVTIVDLTNEALNLIKSEA